MLSDEFKDQNGCGILSPQSRGGATSSLHLYVEDADKWFNRAVEAGATIRMPVSDTFWGDRYGQIVDPFGNCWSLASRVEDLTQEQVTENSKRFFKEQQ